MTDSRRMGRQLPSPRTEGKSFFATGSMVLSWRRRSWRGVTAVAPQNRGLLYFCGFAGWFSFTNMILEPGHPRRSANPGVTRAEFCRCWSPRRIAGSGLPDGRCGTGSVDFPGFWLARFAGGARGRGRGGVGKRSGREYRAGRRCGDGADRVVEAGAGHRSEVVGGHNDICVGIGCWAHGAAPLARRPRGRSDRAAIGFELLCQGRP